MIKVHNSPLAEITGKRPKSIGFSLYKQYEMPKKKKKKISKKRKRRRKKKKEFSIQTAPYIKYSLTQFHMGKNLELVTLGSLLTVKNFIISYEYSFPFHQYHDYYNNKGRMNISIGVFLN